MESAFDYHDRLMPRRGLWEWALGFVGGSFVRFILREAINTPPSTRLQWLSHQSACRIVIPVIMSDSQV